eukprot:gb/GEZN01019782.1/.p1 GENE.gb/GEZN01019782.1/~~gb/GEZN01019782.1/.p1  ORF type:complete len:201 (+),score=19.82 gb/GEZN01019782.1/:62-664(+)
MVKNKAKILALAKGFQGRSKNCFQLAKPLVHKALQYAYIGRKLKKRDMRKLWIQRINAGSRHYGVTYSQLIRGLDHSNMLVNRKMLSNLAYEEPYSFRAIVGTVHNLANLPTLSRNQFGEVASTIHPEFRHIPLKYAVNYRSFDGTLVKAPGGGTLLEEFQSTLHVDEVAKEGEEEEGGEEGEVEVDEAQEPQLSKKQLT